jgi:hypothetical protein
MFLEEQLINYQDLNRAINAAFEATADAYEDAQIQALNAPIYKWDGTTTIRKSGKVVTSPRDVVDTGELQRSLFPIKSPGFRVYLYLINYAADVHEGYETDSGKKKPARPWTKVARERYIDLESTMALELNRRL